MVPPVQKGLEHRTEVTAAQRRAALVGALAGLLAVPYFWLFSSVVGWPGWDAPPPQAGTADYIEFYLDGHARIPLVATIAIGSWVIWLTLVVAMARAARDRLDLGAVLAVTLAGASTAVYVAAEGVLAWPTIGLTTQEVSNNLDPGVAQAIVLSRDGLHAAAAVLLGVSMLMVSWLLARGNLWGHWLLAALGAVAGLSACSSMIVGPEGVGAGAVLLWGVIVGVVVPLGLRRNAPRRTAGAGPSGSQSPGGGSNP